MNRRDLLKIGGCAFAAAAVRTVGAQTPIAECRVRFGETIAARVPLHFNGLSYESPQLANPLFFSARNAELVSLFRELAPTGGVLRTGGNLSAFTAWRDDSAVPLTAAERAAFEKGKRYWEWDLTDPTVRNGNREPVFTPACIEALGAFLDATNWKLLYGLNFGTGTPEQAAAEVAVVTRFTRKHLIAFQLGNEIDFWPGSFRGKDWTFQTYFTQWKQWVAAIRAKVPNAPFAGPDVAIRLDWMEQMAAELGPDITLLSKHHYAMGPAGDPRMDAAHLLGPDPDVAKEIASAQRAKTIAGVPFRNTESGSCFHGGQPGVSDAFASALWAADYMLTLAQGGHDGVNMHGGGEGYYSPIVGDPAKGFTRRPLFYGMQLAQMFCGTSLLQTEANLTDGAQASAFAANDRDGLLFALINKGATQTAFTLQGEPLGSRSLRAAWKLDAPALDSRTGVSLHDWKPGTQVRRSADGFRASLPPYTAAVLRLS